jgi:hypothetical protein
MTLRATLIMALVGGVAWAVEAKKTAQPSATTPAEGVIDPRADAQLRRMSDYLAGLKTLRVDTTTVDQKVATDGEKVEELQQSKVTVRRPGELRVDRVSPLGHNVFRSDGKHFTLYSTERNVYANAPAPATLDAAIDQARELLRIDAPAGDLMVSDPYRDLVDGTISGRYIGLEPIDGVMAHHLAITKKDVDWQIWIQDGPKPVPLRYVIISKDLPGRPQFTIELRHWQTDVTLPADSFTFRPPAGAKRVDFAQMGRLSASTRG